MEGGSEGLEIVRIGIFGLLGIILSNTEQRLCDGDVSNTAGNRKGRGSNESLAASSTLHAIGGLLSRAVVGEGSRVT